MNANSKGDNPQNEYDYKKEYNRVHRHYIRDWEDTIKSTKMAAKACNHGNVVFALGPLLRTVIGLLVSLALLASALHFTGKTWTDADLADASKASQLGNLTNRMYTTPIKYTPLWTTSYEKGVNEKYVNLRVRVLGVFDSVSDSSITDLDTIDVIDDIFRISWVAFGWFLALTMLSLVRTIAEISGADSHINADDVEKTTLSLRVVSSFYNFICAFENIEASERFMKLTALDPETITSITDNTHKWVKILLSMVIRSLFTLVRDGFFVVFTAMVTIYAYITLAAFEGSCDTRPNSGVLGGCSVQNSPVRLTSILFIGFISIASRVASSYNYRDDTIVDITPRVSVVGTQVTLQSGACVVSVICSLIVLMTILGAFFTIDGDRRYPYENIVWTFGLLEVFHIINNIFVFVVNIPFKLMKLWSCCGNCCGCGCGEEKGIKKISDNTRKFQKNMKVYVEGKIFGALYFATVSLSIYMSLRLSINMFGTYWSDNETGMTILTDYHPKQLSEIDDRCHYIDKQVFDNPSTYGFSPCANADEKADCCPNSTYDDSVHAASHLTGLWVAITGCVVQVLLFGWMAFSRKVTDWGSNGSNAGTGFRSASMMPSSEFTTIRVV